MKKTIRNSYYAYKLIDARNDVVFYVGKGYSSRMYAHKTEAMKPSSEWTNPHKCRKILKILQEGGHIKYEYVLCDDEHQALELEKSWIALYGIANDGGQLTNISYEGQVANPKTKPVDVYRTNGEFVASYHSCVEAAAGLGIGDPGIIRRCMKHYDGLTTHKGLVFIPAGGTFVYVDHKKKLVHATSPMETLTFVGTKEAARFFNRSTSCVRQGCTNNWKIGEYVLSYTNDQVTLK